MFFCEDQPGNEDREDGLKFNSSDAPVASICEMPNIKRTGSRDTADKGRADERAEIRPRMLYQFALVAMCDRSTGRHSAEVETLPASMDWPAQEHLLPAVC